MVFFKTTVKVQIEAWGVFKQTTRNKDKIKMGVASIKVECFFLENGVLLHGWKREEGLL